MKTLLCALLSFAFLPAVAQKDEITPLFSSQEPLDMKLATSIKDLKKKTNDSTYLPSYLHIKNSSGGWDSIAIEVRARGVFRRANCYFAPIRIKVKKPNAKGTLLEGNKSLKLVMPCQRASEYNNLVLKEFICYKFYEKITPYHFKTRLVNLTFSEVDGKKRKDYQLTTYLIEDDDLVAKRHDGKISENLNLHPLRLSDTLTVRHDLFQFMIANTDWSTMYMHNAKIIFKKPTTYLPMAYDFDQSGFVDAPYAVVNADLGIASPRDRLYRGFCRDEATVQVVRREFLSQEPAIMETLRGFEKSFIPRDFSEMQKYMADFFAILKNNGDFKRYVLDKCRKK